MTPRIASSLAVGLSALALLAACSDDASPEPTAEPVRVETPEVTTTSTSTTEAPTTTASSTTTSTTVNEAAAADGIASPEDAAVFVMAAWIDGDREAAARHTEPEALEVLFDFDPPSFDDLELVDCDSSDLVRFDCFLVAAGQIYVIGVEDLRVVEVAVDDGTGHSHSDDGDDDHGHDDHEGDDD